MKIIDYELMLKALSNPLLKQVDVNLVDRSWNLTWGLTKQTRFIRFLIYEQMVYDVSDKK